MMVWREILFLFTNPRENEAALAGAAGARQAKLGFHFLTVGSPAQCDSQQFVTATSRCSRNVLTEHAQDVTCHVKPERWVNFGVILNDSGVEMHRFGDAEQSCTAS